MDGWLPNLPKFQKSETVKKAKLKNGFLFRFGDWKCNLEQGKTKRFHKNQQLFFIFAVGGF